MVHYPFPSRYAAELAEARRAGKQPHYWVKPGFDIQARLKGIQGPFIEIGGPTDGGYVFLHDIELPSPVIITNVSDNPLPFAPDSKVLATHVEKVFDGRHLPYPDNSLAMVLAQHLPVVDDQQYDFSSLSDEDDKQLWSIIDRSRELEKQVAATGHITDETLHICLRLAIAKEVYTKLQPGGLYLTDATKDQQKAFQVLGFSVAAEFDRRLLDSSKESHYDLVFVK